MSFFFKKMCVGSLNPSWAALAADTWAHLPAAPRGATAKAGIGAKSGAVPAPAETIAAPSPSPPASAATADSQQSDATVSALLPSSAYRCAREPS